MAHETLNDLFACMLPQRSALAYGKSHSTGFWVRNHNGCITAIMYEGVMCVVSVGGKTQLLGHSATAAKMMLQSKGASVKYTGLLALRAVLQACVVLKISCQ